MKWFLVVVFSLLQMYLAQNSAIQLLAAGQVGKKSTGVAAVNAFGDNVAGVAVTDVKRNRVTSIAAASASSKKHHPPPKKHHPPPKKHHP